MASRYSTGLRPGRRTGRRTRRFVQTRFQAVATRMNALTVYLAAFWWFCQFIPAASSILPPSQNAHIPRGTSDAI